MRKPLHIIAILTGLIFSGCIINATPRGKDIITDMSKPIEFSIKVFPSKVAYSWTLDGSSIAGANTDSFTYNPVPEDNAEHKLTVTAGMDTYSWTIKPLGTYVACVNDVVASFENIDNKGSDLAFWDGGLIPWPKFTQAALNVFGLDNHFQSIVRLGSGNYLAISGSDLISPPGDLYIVRLGSRSPFGPFGSNLENVLPSNEDRIVKALRPGSSVLWHPGGMSVYGNILVVPVEDYRFTITSKVLFYDVTDPENPIKYEHEIDRTVGINKDKGGAVALTRLDDGRYLLADRSTSRTWFYVSNTMDFNDGFDSDRAVIWDETNVQAAPGLDRTFGGESINFIRQCDGKLFLIDFEAEGSELALFVPFVNKRHYTDLYTVEFPDNDYSSQPNITKVATRDMSCADSSCTEESFTPMWRIPGPCDFAAASGSYITPGGQIAIYAAPHYRSAGIIRMREFWPVQ